MDIFDSNRINEIITNARAYGEAHIDFPEDAALLSYKKADEEELDRNRKLRARILDGSDVCSLDEVIANAKTYGEAHIDTPGPRAEQLAVALEKAQEDRKRVRATLFDTMYDAYRSSRAYPGQPLALRTQQLSYFTGIMEAFCLVTGEDPEATYEALQDRSIADHERDLAAREY